MKQFEGKLINTVKKLLLAGLVVAAPCTSFADQVRVAAAANFREAMTAIAGQFEEQSEHEVILIFGSTGKHYAQIVNGAPFDVYFAADAKRPLRLEGQGLSVPGSRFTYAIGSLVLWSPKTAYVDTEGEVLKRGDFRHIAIANPELAPYGQAAREVLHALGIWNEIQPRLVKGENISQAFQFVVTGNAELGFIAGSQLKHVENSAPGSYWRISSQLHTPIEQQAVALNDSAGVRDFISFIRSEEAEEIILSHGYGIPGAVSH
jgi:molybdate transport system substrate-binding protein